MIHRVKLARSSSKARLIQKDILITRKRRQLYSVRMVTFIVVTWVIWMRMDICILWGAEKTLSNTQARLLHRRRLKRQWMRFRGFVFRSRLASTAVVWRASRFIFLWRFTKNWTFLNGVMN